MNKIIIVGIILSIMLIAGCQTMPKQTAEEVVKANAELISSQLENCGYEMNTNRLSYTFDTDKYWKVEVYREVSLEDIESGKPFPDTFCIVYASIEKDTMKYTGLDYMFGCEGICKDSR
ncbi:hypothetical protein KY337_05410 [Candidatus Woesearchaeota archaeon]|nr:hypothetical protein [Candidatus Woesearchaeota archaeon]